MEVKAYEFKVGTWLDMWNGKLPRKRVVLGVAVDERGEAVAGVDATYWWPVVGVSDEQVAMEVLRRLEGGEWPRLYRLATRPAHNQYGSYVGSDVYVEDLGEYRDEQVRQAIIRFLRQLLN